MDVNSFMSELLQCLSHLDFVDKVDLSLEIITIKGRALLKRNSYFLEIYYNEQIISCVTCAAYVCNTHYQPAHVIIILGNVVYLFFIHHMQDVIEQDICHSAYNYKLMINNGLSA